MASFKCEDIGMTDDFELRDSNEEEMIEIVTLHVKKSHGIQQISPEMMGKIKKAIISDDNCGDSCSTYA